MNSSLLSTPFAGVFGLGATEMIVILIIVLLLFGGAKLPSLAKGLGQSIKEFKKASKGEDEEPAAKTAVTPESPKKTEPTHGSN
jgi:sec-independent protein translocase protein TatA